MNLPVIFKHALIISGITALLALFILFPFLPGNYDPLAMPVSVLVQIFGTSGLLLSVTGLLWLLKPARARTFGLVSLYLCTLIAAVLSLISYFIAGMTLGILIALSWAVVFAFLKREIKRSPPGNLNRYGFLPVYLIFIPISILIIPLTCAGPITNWTRNKAIINAADFIDAIEKYHIRNGHYPATLQAMYIDYYPDIAGIEKYHYLPEGGSYNLSFEQPRFLFDVAGTREWVVYNPKDKHKAFSHTSWFLILSSGELERSQGWYDSGNTAYTHWKYFLFD
ncbi:MAG: hypothetical protein V1775_07615 [Bacteroidota bacterium]